MSREKKFDKEVLLDIIQQFFQANKNTGIKMNFSTLASYARDELHHIGIEYYHFSRNKEVSSKVKEFNSILNEQIVDGPIDNSFFATLNISDFLKSHGNNPLRLKMYLQNIQDMQKQLYDRTLEAELKAREMEKTLINVNVQNEKYKVKVKELTKENNRLKEDVKAYKAALQIKEENQLIYALNTTELYTVESEQLDKLNEPDKMNIKTLNRDNGANIDSLIEQFNDLYEE
ncbi:hypothetical protein [Paenibacillus sp. 22594]|uniref:hypothetical protein n=1 Tax=Paenibacillus sp. 22594 TaxID=3453947 RepID=UPI003F84DA02